MATARVTVRPHITAPAELLEDEVFVSTTRPVQQQFGDPITLLGQWRFRRNKDQSASKTGDDHYSWAWFDVSHHELTRKGVADPFSLKNAQVTGIERLHGVDGEDFIVTEVQPKGHLKGGPVFFQLFIDKHKDRLGTA